MKSFAVAGLLCFVLFPLLVPAQYFNNYKSRGFTEVGLSSGISGYSGDLGGTLGAGSKQYKDFDPRLPNLSFSVDATYKLADWLNVRPNIMATQINGDDKSLSTSGSQDKSLFYRNLSFRSMVYEAALLAEVNGLYFLRSYAEKEHRFFPYAAAGIGGFYFNPKANLEGKWYDLQPLSLEGQGMVEYPDRKIYSKLQLCLPVGGGFKYYLTPSLYAGGDFLFRKTFTDYLDDVSTNYIDPSLFDKYFEPEKAEVAKKLSSRNLNGYTPQAGQRRGSPTSKDAYFTFCIRLGIRLGGFD